MRADQLDRIIQLRHMLHQLAELSGNEERTREILLRFLKENSRAEIHERGLWFYACFRSGTKEPAIAFRADIDAVAVEETSSFRPYASCHPGTAHKCGHDGHAAALAGLALLLSEQPVLPRDVYLIFQHAEETGQGAAECRALLREERISEIYAFHNYPGLSLGAVSVSEGCVQPASEGLILRFTGQPSHASNPEKGKNPAFAIARLALMLPEWTSAERWHGFVRGTIIQMRVGERAFGVSPGDGELLFTLRAEREEELELLREYIVREGETLAAAYGLEFNYQREEVFPETRNHPEAVKKARMAALSAGLELKDLPEPFLASEDFGYYTKLVPGAMMYIGAGDCPPLHSSEYDFRDELLEPMISVYLELLAENQELY